jgi:hypothetical protein
MPTTIYLRRTINRPLTVTELDANFSNLQTAVDNKALSGLTDVLISSIQDDQILQYNSSNSKWENVSVSTVVGNSYIQNQSASNQTATFRISGDGMLGGSLMIGATSIPVLHGYYPRIQITDTSTNLVSIGLTTTSHTALIGLQSGSLDFRTTAAITIQTNSTDRWKFTTNGHFIAATDGVSDIGDVSNNRPRNLYLAEKIIMNGGSTTIDPTANLSSTASNDLRISTTDVLALSAATIVVGGNTLTQANAHGHITVKTSGAGSIYMDSTNNIGVGVGFDNSNVPASTVHVKAGTATTRIESTSASVNTQLRIQDTFVAYGMGIRANELSFFQYPLTSSADNITVTGSELLLGFDTNKKMKLSTTIYGSSAGLMKMQANGVVTIDTSTYLTQNQTVTLTGHVTGSGATTIATTLATVGTAGTYSKVTTDAYGRVTSGANITASDVTTALTYTPVNKAGDTMTGALTLSVNPTADYHAATKIYVDALAQGLSIKQSVRVATTTNITLNNTTTIVDGVTLANGDRILVKDQSTGSQNGVYIVSTSGSWTRATDFDADADVVNGFFTFVKEGTTNADSGWVLTTNDTIVVGTTSLSFTQFSGAGQITAGTGLTKTGNTLSIANTGVTAQSYGSHGLIPQIVVNAQGQITSAQNVQSGFVTNIGDGSSLTYTITHNLGSRDVVVQMYDASTYEQVSPNINRATTNTISITGFLSAPSTNQYRVVITRVL